LLVNQQNRNRHEDLLKRNTFAAGMIST